MLFISDIIFKYQNLVFKILNHYKVIYNFNNDLKEDLYHEGIIALINAYNTYKEESNIKFITYASKCINNRYKDIFKKKHLIEEPLDINAKDDLYLIDTIPSKEELILNKTIRKETKDELSNIINSLSIEDEFIICNLYGINTKKITQKELSKMINRSQSYIAKKHKKILSIIKENLVY